VHIFGLTGGIGSGKSTVARRFRARGLPVVDADQLAREVARKGSPGLSEIVSRFGAGVLDAHGELDRKKLAAIVFQDDAARRALNAITHPRVGALSAERFGELDRRGEPLACYEVPLLFEGSLADAFRPVVVVWTPLEVQVARAASRDDVAREDVLARVRAQMPLDDKVRRADYVVDNSGDEPMLLANADAVLDAICERFGVDASRYPKPPA
jgi:dephospho-CoA kinase